MGLGDKLQKWEANSGTCANEDGRTSSTAVEMFPLQELGDGGGTNLSARTPLPLHNVISGGLIGVGFRGGETLPETGGGDLLPAVRSMSTKVAIGMQIFNATKVSLIPQDNFTQGGTYTSPYLPTVEPAVAEGFVARKDPLIPGGSSGTASWRIGTTDDYLVVGWSVPYSHTFHSNYLMAGITHWPAGDCFRELYRQQGDWFTRKAFSNKYPTTSLEYSAGGYNVVAFMGSGHRTEACVVLMPDTLEELEESLRNFILWKD